MLVSELGEFGLIALVQQWTRSDGARDHVGGVDYNLAVANGDDTAAITFPFGPVTELYTTDTMVDGVHFTAQTTPWADLGWKSIASNVSDVAAMGGDPLAALVTLGLPPDTEVANVEQLYSGMMDIGREYGVQIIGGDMVRSPVAFVTVALTGTVVGTPMVRTTAEAGNLVAVSGPVGSSAGGLRKLLGPGGSTLAAESELIDQHRRPWPHVDAGKILLQRGVRCAMDVSDGLADDLGKLCLASGVSARIRADRVPASPALKAVHPERWLDLALYGGEDYVLLFVAPGDIMDAVFDELPHGAAVIGEITHGNPGSVSVIDSSGDPVIRAGAGWDHFSG